MIRWGGTKKLFPVVMGNPLEHIIRGFDNAALICPRDKHFVQTKGSFTLRWPNI